MTRLPWRRPRYELLLLLLVALAALLSVAPVNPQDQSRLCLTQALVHGKLSNDSCLAVSFDRASYGGHLYSDKAPGMSVLELPTSELVRLGPVTEWPIISWRLWVVRVLCSGLAFLIAAFLVGRIAEGLARNWGGAALAAFALGTLFAPLASANFSHVAAGTAAFAAFAAAWRRRFVLSGLLAGASLLLEYQVAAIVGILALYVALSGRRPIARYLAGVLPGVGLLLAYDALAFGSPWHLSYRYESGPLATDQASGFFGIGLPRLHSAYEVFLGSGGLLVISPVLIAAAFGLVLLMRSHPAEALVCAAVALFFILLDCSYYLPYGGISPGPRFLVPALPFLAVGLGPAFARHPWPTRILGVASVVAMTATTLSWSADAKLHQTIWGELARMASQGRSSRLVTTMATATALLWTPLGSRVGIGITVLAAAAAVVIGFHTGSWNLRRGVVRHPWRTVFALAAATAFITVASLAAAKPLRLDTAISSSTSAAFPGSEVDFTIVVANHSDTGLSNLVLHVQLPGALSLLGRPVVERGAGCTGTTELSCDLQFLRSNVSTTVKLGTRVEPGSPAAVKVTAWGTSRGVAGSEASVKIELGSG